MIKAAIKSTVSHLAIVHVLKSTGCLTHHVVVIAMAGFAQRGYGSRYYFQLQKESMSAELCLQSRRKGNSSSSPICVLYLAALSVASKLTMALYYFLSSSKFSCLSRSPDFFFPQFTLTNYTNKYRTELQNTSFFLLPAACTNNEIFN